ncbi:MAG: carbonic anhydrase [Achromobacter sp.]|jgi:carbonic anhydrase|uniref:Carbonic anhydrase n=1 Tax=Achromobacter insuavis TaxID=1287735 RepID=A0A6J4ZPI0_9BURK|nr:MULTISPECIES: carbonic anhydrase [Achromobacter]MBN9639874.1 carbonic anhydrase [Achromobacter sp.]CAB3631751.1 Carbonic anhydrase 1 [Achromobacter insuavis]CUI66646.1 Carbonic anhydrase 1 [Achromobacter sp. 2789STDY5608633]CUJ10895.1 Carbonic anhydrase 1 [Achromobacter sp. 2789STDY5608628]
MFPKRLTEGYQSFLAGRFHSERSRYEKLAETGQSPEILIIGCCDSRVSPEAIFDAGPGEMFVVRNVANLVPPCDPDSESSYHGTSAAIEFAVNGLNVKHIVVLGHASCGGIRAFFDDAKPLTKGDFIGKWMSQIAPVADELGPGGDDRAANLKRLELAVIGHSLKNLMTFPSIRRRVESGELELHGTYFGVATGVLFLRDAATGEFSPCLETGLPN